MVFVKTNFEIHSKPVNLEGLIKRSIMIFKRKIYNRIKDWKKNENGRTAILIEGARRIGKSTIAEEFAKNEYRSYILIDFAACSDRIRNLFNDASDLNHIFQILQVEYSTELFDRESAIIFDEVQLCPKARQSIKFLVKDGRYDYIETGSLISIRQNIEDILLPSEETTLKMYPMDFEEFRWAMGDTISTKIAREAFESKTVLPHEIHQKLLQNFKVYMLVGGMPQAVEAFVETNNFAHVDRIKREIINLYERDFNRIDPTGNASRLFHHIPSQLTSNANRYKLWSASEGKSFEMLQEIVTEMAESMTVNISYHANDPSAGLAFHINPQLFKMFVGDTGLFVTLAFWDQAFTDNVIYKKILANRLEADLGYLYENIVAQMLKASGKELYYYTFPTEKGNHNYEIDFLLPHSHKILALEVKSSGYKSHRSLDAFYSKFSNRIEKEYLIYNKEYMERDGIVYLPIYFVPYL